MRIDPGQTRAALLQQLEDQAAETWGADRLEALRPNLARTAEALWELYQHPLELLDEEPRIFGS